VFVFSTSLLFAATAHAAPSAYRLDPGGESLTFEGRSTLHHFSGRTRDLSGAITYDPDAHRLEGTAEIRVPIAGFTTGNRARDRAMRAMFEVGRYPDIRVVVRSIQRMDAPLDALGRARYRMSAEVRIRETVQTLEFDAWALESAGSLEVSGELPVTTTQFGLSPPSVFGIIRVDEHILVRFQSRWKREG
jgi:polyisoprenoid-binding protein YceI